MSELRRRVRAEQSPPRFDPCLPRAAAGPNGFRILAHRRGRTVRLFSRNGHNFADRFPLAAAAIEALPVPWQCSNLIRGHATDARAVLCAFDLLEVNGEAIRRVPIEDRKRRLAGLLWLCRRTASRSTRHSRVMVPSSTNMRVRSAARASCRNGWARRTAPAAHWLKVKDPAAPAVRREAEEEWR
jgi:ATP-dependent DNA ligase